MVPPADANGTLTLYRSHLAALKPETTAVLSSLASSILSARVVPPLTLRSQMLNVYVDTVDATPESCLSESVVPAPPNVS